MAKWRVYIDIKDEKEQREVDVDAATELEAITAATADYRESGLVIESTEAQQLQKWSVCFSRSTDETCAVVVYAADEEEASEKGHDVIWSDADLDWEQGDGAGKAEWYDTVPEDANEPTTEEVTEALKVAKKEMDEIDALVERIGESSDLDDLVHDLASEIASNINNDGLAEQVRWLLANGTAAADLIETLKEAAGEPVGDGPEAEARLHDYPTPEEALRAARADWNDEENEIVEGND